METLREAYEMARKNNGAPGIDGVTFEAVEAQGVEGFIEQIRRRTHQPHLCAATFAEAGDTEGPEESSVPFQSLRSVIELYRVH